MYGDRLAPGYFHVIGEFIRAVKENNTNEGTTSILCPCTICKNFNPFVYSGEIESLLIIHGFMPNYTCWSRHGESMIDCSTSSTNLHSNYENTFNNNESSLYDDDDDDDPNDDDDHMDTDVDGDEQDMLHTLFAQAEIPLYKDCKYMKLDVVLSLLNMKLDGGWSDRSFTLLLESLNHWFPEDNELPTSTYQAKKLMCPMGLEVQRIHACPNNYMLFRGEGLKRNIIALNTVDLGINGKKIRMTLTMK